MKHTAPPLPLPQADLPDSGTPEQPLSPQPKNAPTGIKISPPPKPPHPESTSDTPDFQSGNF